ncbi:MAG: hypothetical protein OZ928_06205 [Polyangiaceae bacterium]|nr:hypothetical protein [Polyangiaceae bacterium]
MSSAWIQSLRFAVLVVAGALLVQCSSPDASWDPSPPGATVEAGTVAPQGTSASIAQVAALANPAPALAARVASKAAPAGFVEQDGALASPGWRRASQEPSRAVGALFSQRADQGFRVSLGASDEVGLTLTPRGARSSSAVLDAGRLAYPDAYPSTDLVAVADDDVVEWMYLLRDEQAPATFSLDVALGSQLADLRLDNSGALLAVDAKGEALFRIARPFALDATGARRDAGMEYRDGRLTLQLDTTGLTYPVLLDPAVETAVWEVRQTPPPPRRYPAMTYDEERRRVVLFGGLSASGSSAPLGDTWEWDGVTWTLRSTTGPQARQAAAMVYDTSSKRALLYGGASGSTRLGDLWEWNGASWKELCTSAACEATAPAARQGATMVYDPDHQATVLFGGFSGSYQADTWKWNGSSWSQVTGPGPSARMGAAGAWDYVGHQLLLFGGTNGSTYYDDTWTFNGTSWTLRTGTHPSARAYAQVSSMGKVGFVLYGGAESPTESLDDTWEWNGTGWSSVPYFSEKPPKNAYGAMAFYSDSMRRAVVFGGDGAGAAVWSYDFVAKAWSQVITTPPARTKHAMAYDPLRGRTVMYGGVTASNNYLYDTWEWLGSGWQRACEYPDCPSLTSPALAYDAKAKVTLLFGDDLFNTLWSWNGVTWTKLCGYGTACAGPSARMMSTLAYDPNRERTVLFGGMSSGAARNDTWEWDGSQWIQACVTTPCINNKPSPRYGASMAYDGGSGGVLLLFGGTTNGTDRLSDTWEWNGSVWTRRATSGPSGRYGAAMVHDPTRWRTVLFGGSTANGAPFTSDETWEWNGQTKAWKLIPSTGPSQRTTAGAFDLNRKRFVLFGGSSNGTDTWGDTWEYYTRGGACDGVSQCDTGYCTDGVCCEAFSCGTCQACDTAANPGVCAPVRSADDLDTCTGANTCSALGECKKKNAQACTSATECASGFCADGYCCNSACDGGCDECASSPGTCTPRAPGHAGSAPACGGFACTGSSGACPTSCTSDSQCVSTHYCAADGTCQPRRASGAACNTAAGVDCKVAGCRECSAGGCVDFVCCAATSCGACQTCSGATPGTCSSVTNADDADSCAGASTCSASGACKKKLGQACGAGADCASGFCADGVCCNGACSGGCDVCKASLGATADGQCTLLAAGASGSGCGNYACTGASGACPSSCANDSTCAASAYCNTATGKCEPDQPNGGVCTTGAQCASGNCVDGFCCNSACTGLCQACSAGKTGLANGTCGSVTGGTDPDNECAQDTASTCQKDGFCNGAGACRLYTSGTACGSPTCTAGVANAAACDGSGTCKTTPTPCVPYACSGTACGTTCSGDGQCHSGYYCATGGTCLAKKADGDACSAPNQCSSGNCADGVCCNTACNQSCQACTAAKKGGGADGTCGFVKVDTDPDNECATGAACGQTGNCNGAGVCKIASLGTVCGATSCASGVQTGQQCDGEGTCTSGSSTPCAAGYTCLNASVCATSCTDDAQCAGGYFCSVGSCVAAQPLGGECNRARQCAGGNCVDGFCCDGVCAGACQACSNAKTGEPDGQCKPVKAATDPDNECAPALQTTCGQNGSCDGSGQCALWALGTSCGTNACSTDGLSLIGSQCTGTGVCQAASTTSCGAYACAGTSCASTCADDSGCAPGAFCGNDSLCHTKRDLAGTCTSAHECKSGFCVEGVCCNTACDGICQACTQAAKEDDSTDGTCGFAKAALDPHSDCPDDRVEKGDPTSCARDGLCDGAGACRNYAKGTACGSTSCAGNVQTGHACDGAGVCLDNATQDCGEYACLAGACTTSCAKAGDCNTAAYCDTAASECKPKAPLGEACTTADTCQSGFCVDGFCCNKACDGQCEACDVGTATGTCSPVNGAPHGARPACAEGTAASGDGACAARTCDGNDGSSCQGYVGSSVACRDQSCAGGVQSFSATCNGHGGDDHAEARVRDQGERGVRRVARAPVSWPA